MGSVLGTTGCIAGESVAGLVFVSRRRRLLASIWPTQGPPNTLCEPFHKAFPVKRETPTEQVASAVNEGWIQGGSFFGSILAGTLLGFFGDKWLGTEPWLVIGGIILGSYSGFMKVWQYSKSLEDEPGER